VLDALQALAQVAQIDSDALRTEQELQEIPARLGELLGDVKRLNELLESERQQLAEADSLVAAQDEEIQNANQALARSKAKGAHARNMREADAVERELEVIRRTMKDRTAERDSLKEVILKRRASLDKHEKEFSELQSFAAGEQAKADARLAELNAKLQLVLSGRPALLARMPGDVARRYDMIRKKRAGIGVVAVKAGTCGGCFVSLPPQQIIAVQRGETFEQCPRCQRMLFAQSVVNPDATS
jgi:predicted  nucleic acid-binding Zn-ribbon protein